MNPRIIYILGTSLFITQKLHAQNYSIAWYKIAGGGGSSSSGVFSLSGTVGQHDAGLISGGNYSLMGGFWSVLAVQTQGAPLLTIAYAANQAVVSWPPSITGWTLQTNTTLSGTNWGNFLGPIVNNTVTNSSVNGNLFFRLTHP